MKSKLHLGGGHSRKEGWLNHDLVQLTRLSVEAGHGFASAQALTRRGLLFFSAPCD